MLGSIVFLSLQTTVNVKTDYVSYFLKSLENSKLIKSIQLIVCFVLLNLAEDNKSLAYHGLRAAAVPLLDLETCRMSDVNGGRSQSILDTMICAGQ